MSFRITTNGMFHSYRGNLSRANKNLFNSMTRVQTERKFNSYAEDPATANRAFQLRRSYWNNGNQIDNTNYLLRKFQTGWDALDSIVDGDVDNPGLDGIITSLRGITGTAGAGRSILGRTLISTAEAIVGAMNVRYGDTYVFAGADGLNVPFEWRIEKDAEGNVTDKILLYRGVPVDTLDPDKVIDKYSLSEAELKLKRPEDEPMTEGQFYGLDKDYSSLKGSEDGSKLSFEEYLKDQGINKLDATFDDYKNWFSEKNELTYEYDTALKLQEYDNAVKLQEMNNESTLVDIGLGFRLNEDGVTINPATAYNSALSGIGVLGFGFDKNGNAKNIVSLMQELGEIFNRCDSETGDYAQDGDAERAEELVGLLRDAIGNVQEQHAVLDGKSDYLQKNLVQLQDNKLNLNEEIVSVEDMDMAEAIEDMMWAQYTYNAALRIGTQILSQSLFDYMG